MHRSTGIPLVDRFFASFIGQLRSILARREPEFRAKNPGFRKRCATCAFNPKTDAMTGYDSTCVNLMDAIRYGKPFYCHSNLPIINGEYQALPKEQMQLCAGYAAIEEDPETKVAYLRAALIANGMKSKRVGSSGGRASASKSEGPRFESVPARQSENQDAEERSR